MSFFLSKENISLIWEILSDHEMVLKMNNEEKNELIHLFKTNLDDFYELEKTNSLLDINKKYISFMLKNINKIQNNNITNIDIKKTRVSALNTEYQKHLSDFDNITKQHTPEVPNFAIELDDNPINDMNKLMENITAARNYDINIIANNLDVPASIVSANNNANNNTNVNSINNNIKNNKLNYITIDNNTEVTDKLNPIDLDKHISWKDDNNPPITNVVTNNLKIIELENRLNSIENNISSINDNIHKLLERFSVVDF